MACRPRVACIREPPLNGLFRSLVRALTEVVVADASAGVEEVERRPVSVVEGRRGTARRTLSRSFSKANSGVCTPITVSRGAYWRCQARV